MLGSNSIDHFLANGRGIIVYHVVQFYLAAAIVHPDKIIALVSLGLEKPLGRRMVILLEFVCLTMMTFLTLHFRAIDAKFSLLEPILLVGFWLVLRTIWEAFDHTMP